MKRVLPQNENVFLTVSAPVMQSQPVAHTTGKGLTTAKGV